MLDDLRCALRQLWRKPGVAVVAALSLALGVGATAAIFGCLDGFYLRPLAVPRIHEVIRLFGSTERDAFDEISYPEYRQIRTECPSLASLAVAMRRGATWQGRGEPVDIGIYLVSPDFFQVMDVRPALGRVFSPADTSPVVVLGHAFWMRHFGGDPSIVGRTIRLWRSTAVNVTVAGVLPPEFRDLQATGDRDVWLPPVTFAAMAAGRWNEFEDRRNTYFMAIGRLRAGANVSRVRAELAAISTRLAQAHPETNARRRFTALADFDWRMHMAGTTGWVMLAMVILLVAISCVNVANLLLARVEARRKEMATRAAVGAGRGRLARQLFAESLLIGAGGTALGLGLAVWLIAALPALIGLPPEYRSEILMRLDPRVLAFTVAVSLATTLLFGLAPSVTGSRTDLALALRGASSLRHRRFPLRMWLAVSQLALALVLVSATAVLGRSFWNARYGEIGIARGNVLNAWSGKLEAPVERMAVERLRALPGVRAVALAFRAPLSHNGGGMAMSLTLPGHPEFSAGQSPVVVKYNSVDPHYFGMLGIRLLKGRFFSDADSERAPGVAVIAEAMARRYWPKADPIGQFIRVAPGGRDYQIVGVVADAPITNVGEIPGPYLYTCWQQAPIGDRTFLIETAGDAAAMGPAVRRALAAISPELKRVDLITMDDLIRDATLMHRGAAQLVALLMALGLTLAAVGFYGVISYGVTLRTHEIGIRMAVGARDTDAAWLVVRSALASAACGIALGLPCSLAVVFSVRAILLGVSPWDPPAFIVASAVLLVVALTAALVPAMRAARVDPLEALRCE